MNCHRCGRQLQNASASGFGPVCERAVLGSKQRRCAARPVDDQTPDLFAEENAERDYMGRVRELLGSINLEMTP